MYVLHCLYDIDVDVYLLFYFDTELHCMFLIRSSKPHASALSSAVSFKRAHSEWFQKALRIGCISAHAPNSFGGRSKIDWLSQRAPNCLQRVGNKLAFATHSKFE